MSIPSHSLEPPLLSQHTLHVLIYGHNRSSEAFTNAYRSAWKSISSGSVSLSSIRNLSTAQAVGVGIVGAELIGFFSAGEILGRFKLVGYRGGKHGEEHH
jgi:hypothetical protein